MEAAMTPEELSWAAGMFEGEGSVRINVPTRRNMGSLLVDMVNTDVEIVEFFQARWPGYMVPVKADGNRRDFYRWRAASWVAAGFLTAVMPHLRTKRVRERAALGLAFQTQKSRDCRINRTDEYAARQREFYDRMAVLNLRGRQAQTQAVVEAAPAPFRPILDPVQLDLFALAGGVRSDQWRRR
jgi:hypothetical protein